MVVVMTRPVNTAALQELRALDRAISMHANHPESRKRDTRSQASWTWFTDLPEFGKAMDFLPLLASSSAQSYLLLDGDAIEKFW